MGIYELALVIYILIWLLALVDAAISRFSRWQYQLGWLLAIFLIPFGNFAYLWFGSHKIDRGVIKTLRKR